jgi:hypothetical protein
MLAGPPRNLLSQRRVLGKAGNRSGERRGVIRRNHDPGCAHHVAEAAGTIGGQERDAEREELAHGHTEPSQREGCTPMSALAMSGYGLSTWPMNCTCSSRPARWTWRTRSSRNVPSPMISASQGQASARVPERR